MNKFEYNSDYDKIMKNFKLKFDALPVYMHGNNIRSVIPSTWRNIRNEYLKNNDCKCSICGAKAEDRYDFRNFHLHEEWDSDTNNYVLILKNLNLICKKCHEVDHIIRIQTLIYNKEMPKEYLYELFLHFSKVNNCTLELTMYAFLKFNYEFSKNSKNFSRDKYKNIKWKYLVYEDIPLYEEVVWSLKRVNLLYEE